MGVLVYLFSSPPNINREYRLLGAFIKKVMFLIERKVLYIIDYPLEVGKLAPNPLHSISARSYRVAFS